MVLRHFLGVDVGTTATKAVLMDDHGQVVRRARSPHATSRHLGTGRVDPASWWESVRNACAALGTLDPPPEAVGLSSHCPVAVFLDGAGKPVTAGYRYDAPGLGDVCDSMAAHLTPAEISRTGNRISPSTFIAAAYLHQVRQEPETARDIKCFGLAGTYLGYRLTGEFAVDPTQASFTGLFACRGAWTWADDLARRLGIPPRALPPIRPSLSVLGGLSAETADTLRLPLGTPVVVGAADTACAAHATGLGRDKKRLLTVGTTHVVTEHDDRSVDNTARLQRAHVREHEWLRHGVTNGGLALRTGSRILGYGDSNAAVADMTTDAFEASPDEIADAPFFVPHVRAERAPFWLDSPCAALLGLTCDTSTRSAAWAVVEGVLFSDRLVWESQDPAPDEAIPLAGDFGEDRTFPALVADAFGATVHLSNESHLPSVGAAFLAAETVADSSLILDGGVLISPRPHHASVIADRWPAFLEARKSYLAATGTI